MIGRIAGQGGGLTINGVENTYTVAAGETITAGDFVAFDESDDVVKAFLNYTETDFSSPTINSEVQFTTSARPRYVSMAKLTDTKIVVAHSPLSPTVGTFAYIVDYDPVTKGFTIGSQHTVSTGYCVIPKVVRLTDTKFAIAYGTTSGWVKVGSVSGTDITFGGNSQIYIYYNSSASPELVAMDETKIAIFSGYAGALHMETHSISGNEATRQNSYSSAYSLSYLAHVAAEKVDDNTIVIAYNGNRAGYMRTVTVSGYALTLNSEYVHQSVGNGSTIAPDMELFADKSGGILVYANDTTTSNGYGDASAKRFYLDGNTITYDGRYAYTTQDSWDNDLVRLNDTEFLWCFRNSSYNYTNRAVILNTSSGLIGGSQLVVANDYYIDDFDAVLMNDTDVVLHNLYESTTYSSRLRTIVGLAGTPLDYTLHGVAKENKVGGETITVIEPNY